VFWAEVFGFIAAVLGVLQAWPQARKIRQLGHGHGVSLTMWVLMTGSSAAWLGQGIRLGSPSLITSTVASAGMNLLVVLALTQSPRVVVTRFVVLSTVVVVAIATLPLWFTTPVLFAFTLSRLPQIARSWKSKKHGIPGSAVSMGMLSLSIACLLVWEVYSILWKSWVLIGTTTVALSTSLLVAYLYLSNAKNHKKVHKISA
jgi:uncharacterized protein with PQ loop repeat